MIRPRKNPRRVRVRDRAYLEQKSSRITNLLQQRRNSV